MNPFSSTEDVTFSCLSCHSESSHPGYCPTCNRILVAHRRENDVKVEVYNATQLPARVHATDCGPHLDFLPRGRIYPLVVPPNPDTTWENRHVWIERLKLRALSPDGNFREGDNYIVCVPGQPIDVSCFYRCEWQRKANVSGTLRCE